MEFNISEKEKILLYDFLDELYSKLSGIIDFESVFRTRQEIFNLMLDYSRLLSSENTRYNLIGLSTVQVFFTRHLLDSFQIIPSIIKLFSLQNSQTQLLSGSNIEQYSNSMNISITKNIFEDEEYYSKHTNINLSHLNILDLGTGAGIPGLILAMFLRSAKISLIDKSTVKMNFLKKCIKDFGMQNQIKVFSNISEVSSIKKNTVVVSRAFKNLQSILEIIEKYCANMLKKRNNSDNIEVCISDFLFVLLKGKNVANEIKVAHEIFSFRCKMEPSLSNIEGNVLSIDKVFRKNNHG